ncbi:hypothetical protein ABB26_08710 [Stenotrophomonas humi]|uniref:DUF2523 domain-containing protein n=1 Tax=Stenotrophomonas humi TaxID=405444 RepID=A0A0R0C307_9GAMM|nr:DUF2523 family protein [Stenotrophomonas humi]KRG64253.1 hypothetical protein ABB26_08710 [Stenotrophomonas humi]
MLKWLSLLLKNLLGDGVGRVLGGAGLSLVTGAVALPLITTAMNTAASKIGGIGGDVLNVALLFGFGEALSIMGTAMLTRAAMGATRVGIKRATK